MQAASPGHKVQPGWRTGLAGRLFVATALIGMVALASSGFALIGATALDRSLGRLTSDVLPRMSAYGELARSASAVSATTARLVSVGTDQDLATARQQVQVERAAMETSLAGPREWLIDDQRRTIVAPIEELLRVQEELIEVRARRIAQQASMSQRMDRVRDAHRALHAASAPLVDDLEFELALLPEEFGDELPTSGA